MTGQLQGNVEFFLIYFHFLWLLDGDLWWMNMLTLNQSEQTISVKCGRDEEHDSKGTLNNPTILAYSNVNSTCIGQSNNTATPIKGSTRLYEYSKYY